MNVHTSKEQAKSTDESPYQVDESQLPFSCPPKNAPVWNQHPRVYMEFSAEGDVSCPYCGAKYTLTHD